MQAANGRPTRVKFVLRLGCICSQVGDDSSENLNESKCLSDGIDSDGAGSDESHHTTRIKI